MAAVIENHEEHVRLYRNYVDSYRNLLQALKASKDVPPEVFKATMAFTSATGALIDKSTNTVTKLKMQEQLARPTASKIVRLN
jgi:hypothetical protein